MPSYESLPSESEYFNGNVFQKMVEDLQLAAMAKRTVCWHLRAVRQLADIYQLQTVICRRALAGLALARPDVLAGQRDVPI